MFNKVKEVKPLDDYKLLVYFFDGNERLYDVKQLFNEIPPFSSLEQIPGLFECVKVDAGGYGISWNDELDLACDELYYNGYISGLDRFCQKKHQ